MTDPRRPADPRGWRFAIVTSVQPMGAHAVSLRLQVPHRVDHLPGQHYVVRLTADDGYVAQRSYSIASPPADALVELGVDVLPDGEVSGFLADGVQPGDELEVRGPIGGWFVWDGTVPALGIGGGSGVVPLVAMARHAWSIGSPHLRLAVAARTRGDLLYADELESFGATVALSRADTAVRRAGRLAAADLAPLVEPGRRAFVCGSTGFAEAASGLLLGLGVAAADVRVERFGPSG